MNGRINILTFTSLWPNAEQPNFGVFVRNRIEAMAGLDGINLRVVAPAPWFPEQLRHPIVPDRWRRMARIPDREVTAGIDTFHPRHVVTPKLGMSFYGRWMAKGAESLLRRLHEENPVDLIDAHYVYPDGYAATLLGERLNIPVVITARGTDINLFPRMPLIRPMVREALKNARGVIAVSEDLRLRMLELGADEEKIAVIRNGVDRDVFFPRDRMAARLKLGIDAGSKVVLTVASLVKVKRIDRLIDAIGSQRTNGVKLFVVGDGPERSRLESRIARKNLGGRVFLPGARSQPELAEWYAAADLFCLASRSEGCPNAVIEAMACGLPVIAADAGGVRELVTEPGYGRVIISPTAQGLAAEIASALDRNWRREEIAAHGGSRSWQDVAREVMDYYASRNLKPDDY
jgi:glycosyltransferase involved in cell wall biosynthesis